jgi:gluconate kinase
LEVQDADEFHPAANIEKMRQEFHLTMTIVAPGFRHFSKLLMKLFKRISIWFLPVLP